MLNKISKYGVQIASAPFKAFIQHVFDDSFDIEEDFSKHSECLVKIGAEIDLEVAEDILTTFPDVQISPEDLVGTWMLEATRDYNNGLYWDEVSEIVKVEKVTETIVVTKWKPICDENSAISFSSRIIKFQPIVGI